MISSIKTISIASGIVGVIGAATFVGLNLPHATEQDETVSRASFDQYKVCLISTIPFFEGLSAGCYTKKELVKFRDATLLDRQERVVDVTLTHPSNYSIRPELCRTCREFEERRSHGWYALSSRDIRREAYFIRACGALDLLMSANLAAANHFPENGPSDDDMSSIGAKRVLRLGDDPAVEAGDLTAKEEEEPPMWLLTTSGQETRLEEIAVADFDGDDIAEILVFLVAVPAEGTAQVSSIALLEKDGLNATVSLTSQPPVEKGQGAAGKR